MFTSHFSLRLYFIVYAPQKKGVVTSKFGIIASIHAASNYIWLLPQHAQRSLLIGGNPNRDNRSIVRRQAPRAPLVERGSDKAEVPGSSPGGSIYIYKKDFAFFVGQ